MKTLPKLSEYVLQKDTIEHWSEDFTDVVNYTNFITQPLNLSHFVPAIEKDGKWIVLEEPKNYDIWVQLHNSSGSTIGFTDHEQYQTALDNVVFKGFDYIVDESPNWLVRNAFRKIYDVEMNNSKIEDLIPYNLEVNENIIKKFGL